MLVFGKLLYYFIDNIRIYDKMISMMVNNKKKKANNNNNNKYQLHHHYHHRQNKAIAGN